jgi:hypothetical protein
MSDDGCVKVFGGKHPHLETVPVPVGEPCSYCDEMIEAAESGFSQLLIDERGSRRIYLHRACFLRCIYGSVAHIHKQCSCYVPGATEGDPPEMTKRQAAVAAVAAWENERHA